MIQLGSCLEDQENDLKIYVLLRAVSHFEEQFKRLPGLFPFHPLFISFSFLFPSFSFSFLFLFCKLRLNDRNEGIHDEEVETDIPMLKKSVLSVLGSMGISNSPIKDEFIHEM